VDCQHTVAVNSATAALHLALGAIGIEEDDEILVPTMTFAATAVVGLYFKARPVLVDCRRDTFNLDPDQIEQAITAKTKAIVPVHTAGQACDMDGILEIAIDHDLRVIEDAAHAFPARLQGKMIGTIGDITCFSFYATKTITTGEGGMATTENSEWADRMRMMGLHGISKDAWKRYTSEGSWYYEILYPRLKYNLTDIAAAIGIEQLNWTLAN
jgi:dTDP-4-amino-4,6-dideoxygalactose transaminase